MPKTYNKLPISVPSVFTTIVDTVSDNISEQIGASVKFKHGTWDHVISRLIAESKATSSKNERYPLIILIHNFEEVISDDYLGIDVSLDFCICTQSQTGLLSDERYSQSYLPILYPIYAEFMQVVADSQYFDGYKSKWYPHTKIDDLHMGDDGKRAYKLPDILDGIFIQGLKLKIDEQKCI